MSVPGHVIDLIKRLDRDRDAYRATSGGAWQIDRLGYELYGLTDDEIHTVEEATNA